MIKERQKMDTITTRTVGLGFAEAEEIILNETPQTVIVFRPQVHDGGIRGKIIRYKKNGRGEREKPISVDFRRLDEGEGVEIELRTEAVNRLIEHIQRLQAVLEEAGIQIGTHQYRLTNANDLVIDDRNKAKLIQKLLEADLAEEVWEQLIQSNPDIASRLANSKIVEERRIVLNQFEEMLINEALSENDWQDFFEGNKWIFGYGLRYQILRMVQTQPYYGGTAIDGRSGQRGDFLAATEAEIKFTCLVEIKKPTTQLLQRGQYRNGAWGISGELAGAVSQIQINCAEWEIVGARQDQNRERLQNIYTVSPKGIVVIGKTSELDSLEKRNSFERFRQELRNPEIITYDELFERASYIIGKPLRQNNNEADVELPF